MPIYNSTVGHGRENISQGIIAVRKVATMDNRTGMITKPVTLSN